MPTVPYVQVGGDVTTSANLTHLYDFNGSLADQLGGPTLSSEGGTLAGGRYSFAPNIGVRLNGGLPSTTNYSIELVMRFDTLTPLWKKFIDFAQRTSDNGVYIKNNTVALFPGAAGSGTVAAGTDFHFVLTRNAATGVATLYLNGAAQISYTGTPSLAAIPPNNVLTFFEDDSGNGPVLEGSSANVSFVNFSEPSPVDAASFHFAYDFDDDGVFDLGDGTYAGSVAAPVGTVPANYLDDGPGTRTVRARILDKDGAFNRHERRPGPINHRDHHGHGQRWRVYHDRL